MLFELLKDIIKLTLIVISIELAVRTYVRTRMPHWSQPLQKRRVLLLSMLISAATAIKVTEDVLGKESGPIDEAILWAIHQVTPRQMDGAFEAISATGSSTALLPVAIISIVVMLVAKRRAEAKLLAATAVSAPLVIYLLKAIVGRARPALWETRHYWGSSFPSGHTLAVAAIATALALCLGRLWPPCRRPALWIAFGWTVLVALSRMVLGVHWPSDVLTAACIGALIPLALGLRLELSEQPKT